MTYKILVTAQRPIALFRNLGLDFGLGLGLGLVNNSKFRIQKLVNID